MAYLVRALPVTGSKWQYIGRRVTLKAATNLCQNTARALGRAVMAVNERTNDIVDLVIPQDVQDTDWRVEQDAKHITPESY